MRGRFAAGDESAAPPESATPEMTIMPGVLPPPLHRFRAERVSSNV